MARPQVCSSNRQRSLLSSSKCAGRGRPSGPTRAIAPRRETASRRDWRRPRAGAEAVPLAHQSVHSPSYSGASRPALSQTPHGVGDGGHLSLGSRPEPVPCRDEIGQRRQRRIVVHAPSCWSLRPQGRHSDSRRFSMPRILATQRRWAARSEASSLREVRPRAADENACRRRRDRPATPLRWLEKIVAVEA